ncbi:transmembrane protein 79-like isoform X1 [Astyanax mexicanus]|uniref:Transmembrane protein 79 n=1 Tax=Astyanax mexicanus TaxID=7994 RepID=A0A8B9JE82_ASTMX|nr:transmembrane protein 79-like isoform X1 [Astyanax mexicanus]
MVYTPEFGEEGGASEGWRGGRDLKDGEEQEEEESNRVLEGREEQDGQDSRMEMSGEKDEWRDRTGGLTDDDDDIERWISQVEAGKDFTPLVTILCPASKQQDLNSKSRMGPPVSAPIEPQMHMCHQLADLTKKPDRDCGFCGERLILSLCLSAAALIFPLLVWAGFELLPFYTPIVTSAPFRLVYTLRCAFFATIPIVLGLLVEGVSRFKSGALKPLFEGNQGVREVIVHGDYVRDSLHLYLLYFIQLTATATYIHQVQLKLVPILTIVFVIGRLAYWVCLVIGSKFRSLGFGLSFLPLLVLLGTNLYFVCSSSGQDVVFDVAPPTTAPPPKLRWWG